MKRIKNHSVKKTPLVVVMKGIEVENLTPVSYKRTKRWAKFTENGEAYFKANIPEKPDALCYALFDPLIDSKANIEKESLFQQYEDHLTIIKHDGGVLLGFLEKYQKHKENLQADLERVTAELEQLKKIKEEKDKENE